MTNYRVEFTEVKPGGHHERQIDRVSGGLADVQTHLDRFRVYALDPIVVTEHTQSDGIGRIVPASEWDATDV